MLVLNRGQRELLADKLLDAANLAVGGSVFAQFVTGGPFSLPVALFGIALWLLLSGVAVMLTGGKTS
jgi:hypothetical protein